MFLLADNGQVSGGVGHLLTGHHFHTLAADSDKIVHQCDQFGAGKVILNRVCQHCCPTSIPDPCHYLRYIGPALLYIARLAGSEVFFEGLLEVVNRTDIHQMLGKMGAAQVVVAGDGRPLQVSFDRWTNANAEKVHRLQPFGGYLSEFREFEGFILPTRVEAGNFFAADDYFPFFIAEVTNVEFPQAD